MLLNEASIKLQGLGSKSFQVAEHMEEPGGCATRELWKLCTSSHLSRPQYLFLWLPFLSFKISFVING
jgi:hypothetical protein